VSLLLADAVEKKVFRGVEQIFQEAPVRWPEISVGSFLPLFDSIGPSRHFGKMWNLVAIGRIADMARLAAGSTRSRMTPNGH
jgi:hypothetical protein